MRPLACAASSVEHGIASWHRQWARDHPHLIDRLRRVSDAQLAAVGRALQPHEPLGVFLAEEVKRRVHHGS